MQFGRIFDIAAAIVTVALVTVIVSSPNTSSVITAFGNSFSNSLKAAMGAYA
jgi:uncharacterized membrane protein